MISTDDLSSLPDPASLHRLWQSLAVLDAILCPEWEYRWYSFDSRWGPSAMMGSMRDGSGDEMFALFLECGAVLKGLGHESSTYQVNKPKPWVFERLPAVFHEAVLNERAFDPRNTTFCIWRLEEDGRWLTGAPPGTDDGSASLLAMFESRPGPYVDFAAEAYEIDIQEADVDAVYRHEPLSIELVRRLNPDCDFDAIAEDVQRIGYPLAV